MRQRRRPLTPEEMHVENEHRLTRIEVLQYLQGGGLLYLAAVVTGHMVGISISGAVWLP